MDALLYTLITISAICLLYSIIQLYKHIRGRIKINRMWHEINKSIELTDATMKALDMQIQLIRGLQDLEETIQDFRNGEKHAHQNYRFTKDTK